MATRWNGARGGSEGKYYSQFISRPLSLVYFVASVLKGIVVAAGLDRYLGENVLFAWSQPSPLPLYYNALLKFPTFVQPNEIDFSFFSFYDDDTIIKMIINSRDRYWTIDRIGIFPSRWIEQQYYNVDGK